ncbi:MAG: phosphoadenosine phosphosulfate reductase family protein, partial [Rhodobacteraceae bacterium]|nr:phosphoadenosine phosphosulfate reductase family protein [Paracoccaceae bacterium]
MLDDGIDYATRAAWMNRLYAEAPAVEVIRATLAAFPGRVAVVSSFGAESAVLLDLVAEVDRETPVLMVDTGMLFAETLAYLRDLAAHLGLRDVRLLRAEEAALTAADPDRRLHETAPDHCCALRKRGGRGGGGGGR